MAEMASVPASDRERTVLLAVPAKPDYVVLARLALAAVFRLTPLEPADLTDLKLAITEAAAACMGEDADEPVRFRFALEEDRLVIEIGCSAAPVMPPDERALGRAIIEATVDELETDNGSTRLVKYLAAAES